jgi:DNA-directed RNA polymerase beta subunit
MVAYGAKKAVKEFMSFRSDDSTMKEDAYNQIRQNGYVEMAQLPDSVDNKTTLNTLDAYLISMGIKSDIVSAGYVLRTTQMGQ